MNALKPLLGLLSLLVCLDAAAQFSVVSCPDSILADTPDAGCMVRTDFSFLVLGSTPAATPTEACKIAAAQLIQSSNVPTACKFSAADNACGCIEQSSGFESSLPVTENPDSLIPVCPADFKESLLARVPVVGAEGFRTTLAVCVGKTQKPLPPPPPPALPPPPTQPGPMPPSPPSPVSETCPLPLLHAILDPFALQHERGKYVGISDLEHLAPATRMAAECMQSRFGKTVIFPVAAFLPVAYQAHLKDVWDLWHASRKDTNPLCKNVRDTAKLEWLKHKLVRAPQMNLQHASGMAVDVAGLPAATIDANAAYCGLIRPDPQNSPLHFEVGKK